MIMGVKEKITRKLDRMSESELQQIADFVDFLEFRCRFRRPHDFDETTLADMYAEAAQEDRELAEAGIGEYALSLEIEDHE